MARKKLKRSVGIIRLDSVEKLPGYSKITQANYEGILVTLLAHPHKPAVIMIDNDLASRYMMPHHEIFKALTTVGLKEKLKGAKHANTRRD